MNEPASVATPAPASATPTSDTRPTMAEAFAAAPVETPAASLSADAPADPDQPAAATAPPGPAADTLPAEGPIPFVRHKAVLDRAYDERDQAMAQVQQLQQQSGWLSSPEGHQLQQWADQYRSNPREWFARTAQELAAQSPELASQLRSDAARILASRTPAATSLDPDIPVYDETGRQVNQTYSATRVQEIVQHAVTEALQREVGPLKTDFAQRRQVQETQQIHQAASETATSQFEVAKQWPGFLADPTTGAVDADLVTTFQTHPDWSLERCYIATVVPKLRATEEAKTLATLTTKAAAASGVTPNGASVSATRRPTSLLDAGLTW